MLLIQFYTFYAISSGLKTSFPLYIPHFGHALCLRILFPQLLHPTSFGASRNEFMDLFLLVLDFDALYLGTPIELSPHFIKDSDEKIPYFENICQATYSYSQFEHFPV